MLKVCRRCGKAQDLAAFALRPSKNGKSRAPWCKSCKREYDRAAVAAKRKVKWDA